MTQCTAGLERPEAFPLGWDGRRKGYRTRCRKDAAMHVESSWGPGDLCQEHYERWLVLDRLAKERIAQAEASAPEGGATDE